VLRSVTWLPGLGFAAAPAVRAAERRAMVTDTERKVLSARRSWFLAQALLILLGALLVLARLVLPYQTGLIPGGNIETVNGICRGAAGSPHPSPQSCNDAAAWLAGLNTVALIGCALVAFGIYLGWRVRRSNGRS